MEFISDCGGELMQTFQLFLENAPTLMICGLAVAIVIDYITGLLRALYTRKANSKLHYKGVIKKIGIMTGVLFAAVLDIVLNGATPIFTTVTVALFTAGEGLSIIENLAIIGVPMPTQVKDKLTQIKESEGKMKGENKHG